jgi:hypothetical protein
MVNQKLDQGGSFPVWHYDIDVVRDPSPFNLALHKASALDANTIPSSISSAAQKAVTSATVLFSSVPTHRPQRYEAPSEPSIGFITRLNRASI